MMMVQHDDGYPWIPLKQYSMNQTRPVEAHKHVYDRGLNHGTISLNDAPNLRIEMLIIVF